MLWSRGCNAGMCVVLHTLHRQCLVDDIHWCDFGVTDSAGIAGYPIGSSGWPLRIAGLKCQQFLKYLAPDSVCT